MKKKYEKTVFVLDCLGRTLKKESLHKMINEYLDNVVRKDNIEIVVSNGPEINKPNHLLEQIDGFDRKYCVPWDVIYLHPQYPAMLLSDEDKEALPSLLAEATGSSSEVVDKLLEARDAYKPFK